MIGFEEWSPLSTEKSEQAANDPNKLTEKLEKNGYDIFIKYLLGM